MPEPNFITIRLTKIEFTQKEVAYLRPKIKNIPDPTLIERYLKKPNNASLKGDDRKQRTYLRRLIDGIKRCQIKNAS